MTNSLSYQPTARMLLIQAVEKQLALREQNDWNIELPDRCPPILWFGDAASNKPIVLTVGANPSRREYLSYFKEEVLKKVKQTNNHKSLSYLEPPNNRCRLLKETENLAEILENRQLQDEIITGYNSYFYPRQNNQYTAYKKWFGMNKFDSHNVEGFLRGFGASYYPNNDLPFQAIHIDLFPFATLSDFKELPDDITDRDLFGNQWAANFIQSLIELLQPSLLIIFGIGNVDCFSKYIDNSISQVSRQTYKMTNYCKNTYYRIGCAEKIGLPFIGLNTNLGDPIGFNPKSLNQYGQDIQRRSQDIINYN